MMLQIIAYTIAVAAALSVVALCAERFARLYRLPRRAAWAGAMSLSVLLPAVMILLVRPAEISSIPDSVAAPGVPFTNPDRAGFAEMTDAHLSAQALSTAASAQAVPVGPAAGFVPRSTWKLPRPSDDVIVSVWLAASCLLALYLLGANLLLRRRMKSWRNATVQDHEVLVSEVTGPVLLGAFSPRIVVPRWLLLQPQVAQTLILQHELQHVRSRDALLIMAGLATIVAVPWNVPLWWQWRRMREAIELDCDARVLDAGADANAYAEVLVAVTQRASGVPAGALAMSEPVHALERRIANLLPGAIRHARLQAIAVLLLGTAGAGVALAMDAPALPGRAAAPATATPQPVRPPSTASSASPPVNSASGPTIIAAAAPAPRVVREPPQAVQPQVLAHLAKEPASFVVRILPPVAEPSPRSFRLPAGPGSPPPNVGADAATRERLESYYSTLVTQLTAVPGLTLVTGTAPDGSGVAYEISMGLGANWKGVHIEATPLQNPSATRLVTTTRDASTIGALTLSGSSEVVPVDDPASDMQRYVERLRLELFPPDRALLDHKVSELRDPQIHGGLRAESLHKLMTVDSLYDSSGARIDSFGGRLMTYRPDPSLLGAATEVALSLKDPAQRLWLWDALITGPMTPMDRSVLVAPAGRALAGETDLRVQLMLVNVLNLSARNPLARAALESAARDDVDSARPELVRMAARRKLTDGADWNDYFIARLKDPRVPDAERVELLRYAQSISNSGSWASRGGGMKLDETAERELGRLLKDSSSTEVVAAAVMLLGDRLVPGSPENHGSAVAYEELLDFLQAGTGKPGADPKVRGLALTSLLFDLRLHPEARPVFEEVVVRDRDPALRERARQALDRQ